MKPTVEESDVKETRWILPVHRDPHGDSIIPEDVGIVIMQAMGPNGVV